MRRVSFFQGLFLALSLVLASVSAQGKIFKGPFRAEALAFYIVHEGGPISVEVEVEHPALFSSLFGIQLPAISLVRFFDPEEKLLGWEYQHFVRLDSTKHTFDFRETNAPAGIYQVRVAHTVGSRPETNLKVEPRSSFGILPMRSWLHTTSREQFQEAYFYVPPGADQTIPPEPFTRRGPGAGPGVYTASIRGRGEGKLFGPDGEELAAIESGRTTRVPVTETEVVWRLSLDLAPANSVWYVQGGSFDAILCPDEATARAIGGGVFQAPEGTAYPHRFQVDMHEWIASLTPGDLEVPEVDMSELRQEWTAHPRNRWLFGPWGAFSRLRYVLEHQTLDDPMANASTSGTLAVAYSLDEPFNPFYKNPGILNRLLLSEFGRLMQVRQTDALVDTHQPHSGGDAFNTKRFALALVGPLMEEGPLRDLYIEGARRGIDRFPHSRMSVENQSSHWLINQRLMYEGSGLEEYRIMAGDYVGAMLNPDWNPPFQTGYLMEGYGPDATYEGIATAKLAWYFGLSGDEQVKEGLATLYDLFNHTVAPEPDGRILGASNFSHRTPGSWANRQYVGGTPMMAEHLPEAGAWHPGLLEREKESSPDYIDDELRTYWLGGVREPSRGFSQYRHATRFQFYPETIVEGELPVVAEENFTRRFGDEFYTFRRPGYYAFVYTGKPDPRVQRIKDRDQPDRVQRRTGGGLSMFWTPHFGSAILSTNWNARTNQMIRVDLTDGQVTWPDYWSLEHEFDSDADTLVTTSEIMGLPIEVTRRQNFGEEALTQEVVLTFAHDLELKDLVEQIPFPLSDQKPIEILYLQDGEWRACPGEDKESQAFWMGHGEEGVLFSLETPYPVRRGPDTEGAGGRAGSQVAGQRRGLVEILLGDAFTQNEEVTLRYTIQGRQLDELPHADSLPDT